MKLEFSDKVWIDHASYIKEIDKLFDIERKIKEKHIRLLKDKHNLSFKEISDFMGESLSIIYPIYRYGYGYGNVLKKVRVHVKKRDGNKCTSCGSVKKLHAHHIGKSTNHSIKNLITLCPKCHKSAHKKDASPQKSIR